MVCCRVLGFHRLITSQHSTHTHTPRYSTFAPWFFVFEFWVCCQVLGFHRLITLQHSTHTHTTMLDAHRTIFYFWFLGLFPSIGVVVEFWIFIDWSHSKIPHIHHDARRSPHDFLFSSFEFVFEFWVCCRSFGFHRLITFHTRTCTPRCSRRSPQDFSFPSFGFVIEFWLFIDWSPILKVQVHKCRKIVIW